MGQKKKITVPHEKLDWTKTDSWLARAYRVSRERIRQIRKALREKFPHKNWEPMTETNPAPPQPALPLPPVQTLKPTDENKGQNPPDVEDLDIASIIESGERAFSAATIPTTTAPAQPKPVGPVERQVDFPDETPVPAHVDTDSALLFRQAVCSSVKGGLGIAEEIARTMANAAEIEPAFTEQTLARCRAKPEDVELFTGALDLCLKKHHVQPKHAEEIALAITGTRLFAPYLLLLVEFKAEIERNKKRKDKQ